MIFDWVSYNWAGPHGLLAGLEGGTRFTVLTNLIYILPAAPLTHDPGIVSGNITDKHARSKKELNDIAKGNYTIVEGFCQGFCRTFKKASNSSYYEQLREEVFGYKQITPRMFIEYLKKKWPKLDTMMIKRLQNKFFPRMERGRGAHRLIVRTS